MATGADSIPLQTPAMAVTPRRRTLAAAIVLGVAVLHLLRLSARLPPGWRSAYSSYFSDIVVPVAFYFLLVTQEGRVPQLLPRWTKAAVVFAAATLAEAAQALGIPALGRVADPLDVVMYGLGALLAVGLDRTLLPGPHTPR